MRFSMKWILVCAEVLVFALFAAKLARAAEPTVAPTNYDATSSPYSAARPMRVTMTNQFGQVSTLEYRKPVQARSDEQNDRDWSSGNELSASTSPARDQDLEWLPLQNIRQAGYRHQVNYPATTPLPTNCVTLAPVTPSPVVAPPVTVQYLPTTQYDVPDYRIPVTGAPQVVYRPQMPLVPIAQTNVQVGTGVYGQPVIYRPGQPLRNVWRWLTP